MWGAACGLCPLAEWLALACWTEECVLPFSHPVHEASHADSPIGSQQQELKAHLGTLNPNGHLLTLLLPLELQELVSFPSHMTNPESACPMSLGLPIAQPHW